MALKKILRTLRREGMWGLLVRLRHPHPPANPLAHTPIQRPPFTLEGTNDKLLDAVADAFVRILGPDALSRQKGTKIHVGPTADGAAFAVGDVALFETTDAALAFLRSSQASVPPLRGLSTCSAVLLPSSDCFELFKDAGIGDGRIFVLPSVSAASAGSEHYLEGDLARWLIAADCIDPRQINTALFPALKNIAAHDRLCLSLPESPRRRAAFLNLQLEGFQIFDGIRQMPGWLGVGWSYVTIARSALTQDAVPLMVCEDDVQIEADFHQRLKLVEDYLATVEWDLFSGLLTNLPLNPNIHKIERRGNLTFVHLDYATGMVCNIYNRKALEWIRGWTPSDGNPETDTVDEWLSRMPRLRVVTTLPFLAGHDVAATSTVFGFSNKRYEVMISASERRLAKLLAKQL